MIKVKVKVKVLVKVMVMVLSTQIRFPENFMRIRWVAGWVTHIPGPNMTNIHA